MSLQYIIDAYNLINHPQFRPRAKKAPNIQDLLADFIISNRLAGSKKNRVIIVFDGYPPHGQRMPEAEGLLCLFSRMIEADELIKRLVEESGHRENIIVVSDDRQVREAAGSLRAHVSSVEEFICGSKGKRVVDRSRNSEEDTISYSKMQAINAELRKRWLE